MRLLFEKVGKLIKEIFFEIGIYFLHQINFLYVKLFIHNVSQLHVGCGDNHIKDFENIDYIPSEAVDRILDLRRNLPYSSNSIDIIFSEHVFEHFTPQELLHIFKESHRLLKTNGKLTFSIPDFDKFCSNFLCKKNPTFIREYQDELRRFNIHFSFPSPQVNDVFYFDHVIHQVGEHKFFYTFLVLKYLLQEANFKSIKKRKFTKTIDSESRRFQSMYVVAKKVDW